MKKQSKLKERRVELGYTLEYVGNKVGVSKSTVRKWETGDIANMKRDKISALAEVLQLNPAFIVGVEKDDCELNKIATPLYLKNKIPILGRIRAGMPIYAEENIIGYTFGDYNEGYEYFALNVIGDSMNAARIFDGDLLIVRKQTFVDDGDLAVIIINGEEATLKRFYKTENTITLMPQSTNPEHKPQIYDLKKTNVQILGKVIEVKFKP